LLAPPALNNTVVSVTKFRLTSYWQPLMAYFHSKRWSLMPKKLCY